MLDNTTTAQTLAWDALPGAARYGLLRSGIQITTTKASIVDGGLLANTAYDHAVRAYMLTERRGPACGADVTQHPTARPPTTGDSRQPGRGQAGRAHCPAASEPAGVRYRPFVGAGPVMSHAGVTGPMSKWNTRVE